MVVHARFDGKVLVPVGPVDLPTDRVLELDVKDAVENSLGSGPAILKLLRSLPPVDPGIVDEMMRGIDEAYQPADYRGIFDNETAEAEGDAKDARAGAE